MRNLSLALAALLLGVSVAAAQNAPAPRIDGEGINMDAAPPPTAEPHHPADPSAPNTANPPNVGTTTGQAPKDDRFPADRRRYAPRSKRTQVSSAPRIDTGATVQQSSASRPRSPTQEFWPIWPAWFADVRSPGRFYDNVNQGLAGAEWLSFKLARQQGATP